jgi:hypothetical protein
MSNGEIDRIGDVAGDRLPAIGWACLTPRRPASVIGRDAEPRQVPVEDLRGDRRGAGSTLDRRER